MTKSLRIAMIGQRGVPATFGGIEHHVEELGSRLAARGHDVTVYCRTNYVDDPVAWHRGLRLRHVPTVGTKHLDAIVHSALCTMAAVVTRHDIVHYHALGPSMLAFLPRFLGRARVVATVHGLDDQRAKWGGAARRALRTAGWLSARVPHATVVVSDALRRHYAEAHHRAAVHIPNGVVAPDVRPARRIREELGLERDRYVLFVGRLVPEKAPDTLLRAFRRLPGDHRLVIAGGSSFTDDYVRGLHRLAAEDERVLMPGYVYGDLLAELYSNAAAFVLPSSLEGLPLTLLEAASYGTPVVASAIPPHGEVLAVTGPGRCLVPVADEGALATALGRILADPVAARADAAALRESVMATYDWDAAADATEALYTRLVGAGASGRREMVRPAVRSG